MTQDLEIADKALSGYFNALQQVSDTKNFSLDSALGALGKSAGAIPGIDQSQVTSVDTFATFVAGLATGAMREKTLGDLINDGAPKAKAVVDVLQQVGVPALKTIYRNELTTTTSTFVSYVQSTGVAFDIGGNSCSAGPNAKDFTTGNAFLLAMEYCRRVQAITAKQNALNSYDNSLGSARTTLQQLIDGKDKLKDTDVIQNLLKDASTLRTDVDAMKKAFG